MAENHLAASGTVARYQLDRAQIHQAIYHCHSCEEKELYPAHVGCTSKPSLCYIHAATPQFFCHGFPAACPLNSLPQLLYKTGSLQEHGWQRDCLKSHSSSVVKDKAVLGVLPCQGSSGVSLVLPWGTCPAVVCADITPGSGTNVCPCGFHLQKCKMFSESLA